MKGFFDLDYWPIYLGKKIKALSLWFKSLGNFKKVTMPLRYIWFTIRHRPKNKKRFRFPLSGHLSYWRYILRKKNQKLPLKKLGIIALFSLPVLIFGIFLSLYLFKEARADQFARTAKSAMEINDFRTAFLTAHKAHLMMHEDISILRTLVSSSAAINHFRNLEWSLKLANHSDASLDDQMNYLKYCIEQNKYREVMDWLDQAEFAPERKLDALYLRAMLLCLRDAEGEHEAIALIRECLNESPKEEKFCHLLWEISLKSEQESLMDEGLTHMQEKAEGSDILAKHATRRLILHPKLTAEDRKTYAAKLWSLPNRSLSDAILSIHGSIGQKRLKGSLLMEFLGRQFDEVKASGTQQVIISLLNQIGRTDTVVDLMKMKRSTHSFDKERIISLIKSSLSNGDTTLFRNLYFDHEELLTPTEREFFELLLRLKIGVKKEIGNEVTSLLEQANPDEMETIRRFLFLIESDQIIISFAKQVRRQNLANQEVKYLLINCYQRLADQENLVQLLGSTQLPEKFHSFKGEQQTCYLKALNKLDLENCLRWAEHAFSKVPQSHALRYTLALCYLRLDDPSSALSIIRPLLSHSLPNCPSQRTVAALTMLRNGEPELAQKWAPIDYQSFLLPQERAMIEEILAVQL